MVSDGEQKRSTRELTVSVGAEQDVGGCSIEISGSVRALLPASTPGAHP